MEHFKRLAFLHAFTSSPLSGSLVHKLRRFRSGERFEIVLQGTAKGTLYLMLRVII